MKFGLLTYKYIKRKGYGPGKVNIGDYIQSIAARQFLPNVDVLVDRDSVSHYSGDPIRLIMNGWWRFFEGNEVTSDAITPLYVAFHIANPEDLTKKTLEHLEKHAPIGCRDYATMNCLTGHGIKAYFSSCLTLTLGRTYHVPEKDRTNTVYFVDVDCGLLDDKKPNLIRWCLSQTRRLFSSSSSEKRNRRVLELMEEYLHDAHIEKRKHCTRHLSSRDDNERFQVADQFLRDYSKARMVVTSRLHCALPVLSMGVPVLFVAKNTDDSRFAGPLDNLNLIGFDHKRNWVERLFPCEQHTSDFASPMLSVKDYADRLSLQCQQFVQQF